MRRGLVVGVQTAVLLLAGAVPALSHAIFPGQGPLAAQADQTLTMAVPEERDPDTHNVGVTVALPASWTAVSCKASPPWTCALLPPSGANPAQIQWTRNPAPPPVPDDVTFVFTVHTGGPGSYPIPVNQTYSPTAAFPTGEVVRWIGPPNSGEPAPILTVSAPPASPTPPAPVTPSAPAPAPHPSPTPAPASPHPAASTAHPPAVVAHPSPTVSSAPPSPSPTATDTATSSPTPTTTVISAPNDQSGKKVSSSGGATLAIVAVVVVALLGGGWALLRRRAHGAP